MKEKNVVVVGGTGNVGAVLVAAFLRAGAKVFVPSRSVDKGESLRHRLSRAGVSENVMERLVVVPGDIGVEGGAQEVARRIQSMAGQIDAVVAAPSSWYQNSSMMEAGFGDFRRVMEGHLYPHFLSAEAFLPLLPEGAAYVAINGPAGFVEKPFPGTGSISTAAAAQSMMLRALAGEARGLRVHEVVMHAYMGPDGARAASPLSGEEVGDYVVALVSDRGRDVHDRTLHLRRPGQVKAALRGDFSAR